jgi:fatty-acyl-CoA synthase
MYAEYPLTIDKLLTQTLYRKSKNEIVYGRIRHSWGKFYERVNRLASGLDSLGVKKGSKVAVIDLDTHRYLEAYYAVPMMGAILHTINIRLPPEQISYTMAHAEDDVVLVRDEFLPIAAKVAPSVKSIKKVVAMSDSSFDRPPPKLPDVRDYEDLLSTSSPHYDFPILDENDPATLFYTSGTTGLPKGVSFTHRQIVLHTLGFVVALGASQGPVKFGSNDVLMPLVPFFHVHSWGVPYSAGLLGQKVVLAGRYEVANILETMAREGVTFSHLVPTVLNMVLSYQQIENYRDALSRWKIVVGGSALPRELALKAMKFGIKVMAGYGLSETAPVLTVATPTQEISNMTEEEMLDKVLLKAGLPIPFVDLRVVDENFTDVPRDNKTFGEIVVRAPWTTKEYTKDPERTSELWSGGWLHTGDIAVVDETGYITIVDRIKDVVKSGGEWVSSIFLEDLLMRHPAVFEAAVIGVKNEKWGERPIGIVSLKKGSNVTERELKEHLMKFVDEGKISKFWVPDSFVMLTEPLPKTGTGKIDKKPLREKYSTMIPAI